MRPKKVILCVDDNEQELSVLKFTLATNGYRVLAATNGQEAIAVFSAAPQIDLVLADTNMPQMSGIQLAERLKRMRSHVPMLRPLAEKCIWPTRSWRGRTVHRLSCWSA
jgi:two-component system response regulator CpxR